MWHVGIVFSFICPSAPVKVRKNCNFLGTPGTVTSWGLQELRSYFYGIKDGQLASGPPEMLDERVRDLCVLSFHKPCVCGCCMMFSVQRGVLVGSCSVESAFISLLAYRCLVF